MTNIVLNFILNNIFKKTTSSKGWIATDGPCCIHNGESRPDTKKRCGIMDTGDGVVIHCFNCGFKSGWKIGSMIGPKMKSFMRWLDISESDISKISFDVWKLKQQHSNGKVSEHFERTYKQLSFNERPLPEKSKSISDWLKETTYEKDLLDCITYLDSRGIDILTGFKYYWSPSKKNGINRKIIIPFFWDDKIVGYTTRAIDKNAKYRYFKDIDENYLFNTDVVGNKFTPICEGPFDAIAINGISTLGDNLSKEQALWLNEHCEKIIIVPDREKEGGNLVKAAEEYGWYVSFPDWEDDIKDAADAVKRYGKVYTIWTIMNSITNNLTKIQINKKLLIGKKYGR